MTSNLPLISVIIPVFNVEDYLERCLNSVVGQTYPNLEILIVDDGSTDGSSSIAYNIQKYDDRVIIIHKENGGLSSARNAGLDRASGRYIGFVDGDDYIDTNMYMKLYQQLLHDDSDIAICGRFKVINGQVEDGIMPQKKEIATPFNTMVRLFNWDGIDSASWDKLYKKELWDGERFPIGKTNEDVGTIYKIILRANRISLLNERLIYWVMRGSSITHSINITNVFHFEEMTHKILVYIAHNYPSLLYDAKFYRKSSILYTIMFITRFRPVDYKALKKRFYSYIAELDLLRKTLPFSKTELWIYYRYKFHLLRLSYYKQRLFH